MNTLVIILIIVAGILCFFLGRIVGEKSRDDEVRKLDYLYRKASSENMSNEKILKEVIDIFEEKQ